MMECAWSMSVPGHILCLVNECLVNECAWSWSVHGHGVCLLIMECGSIDVG